ncbi:glycosyltransferase family 2 protein [Candidatus Peregrinibacteria bacterium]|nr:glycosyltransferase family 2 protein [Candidatus Peregrinibacteria bacterium]
MHLTIIIPAYNEEKTIGEVLRNLPRSLRSIDAVQTIVVSDGSQDRTAEIAEHAGVTVVSHPINMGAGAATQTGLRAALLSDADIMVTFDADGQHHAEDIPALIRPIQEGHVDVVSGSRFLKRQKIPLTRRFFNLIGNIITWMLSGIWLTDSQTGMRAFSRKAAEQIEIHVNGYEFCSEIVRQIAYRGLSYTEVPVQVTYNEYTKRKGQNFATGLQTITKLVIRTLMR